MGIGFIRTMVILILFCAMVPSPLAMAQSQLTSQVHSMQDIQTTLDEAPPGAEISIKPGHYVGNLTIRKPVTLIGEGDVILDAKGQGTVVTIESPHVVINGFVIENTGSDLGASPAGVLLNTVKYVTIQNNCFQDVEYGVYLEQASNCKVINNKIYGKTQLLPEDRGDGIRFWNANNNTAQGNLIMNTRDGMLFEFSSHEEISGNSLQDLRYGLHYMYSNNNNFYDNIFTNDTAGAAPMYSSGITFKYNVFYHMVGYQSYGILLKECNNIRIEDNLIFDNTVGIYMDAGFNNILTQNDVVKNGIGIRMMGNSGNNKIYENNFIDNLTQVGKTEPGLPNQWSVAGRGNFWSDFNGYDSKHIGVAKNPYNSADYFSTITSEFPILLQFADSPAITSLKSAENAFPLIQVYGIHDSNPLMKPIAIPSKWNPYLSGSKRNWLFAALVSALIVALGGWLMIRANRKSVTWRRKEGLKW